MEIRQKCMGIRQKYMRIRQKCMRIRQIFYFTPAGASGERQRNWRRRVTLLFFHQSKSQMPLPMCCVTEVLRPTSRFTISFYEI